jgi:putative ABC transport system ATP-binding protein
LAILTAENLSKIYGSKHSIRHAGLQHFNLTVKKGEFIAVMGPSGSGKTSLLNLLATIDRPTSGNILLNGERLTALSKNKLAKFRRTEMGFVFQDYNLLDTLTIGENIVLPLTLQKAKVKEMNSRLKTVTKQLDIETLIDKRTYEVSGGQQQRAAIARAMIHNPAVIFADEPTGNLDSKATLQVMESLETLNKTQETTTVMVTHDPFAASFSGRVIFIKDGRLFNEIHRGDNRQRFFQDILNVQSLIGGSMNDIHPIRF